MYRSYPIYITLGYFSTGCRRASVFVSILRMSLIYLIPLTSLWNQVETLVHIGNSVCLGSSLFPQSLFEVACTSSLTMTGMEKMSTLSRFNTFLIPKHMDPVAIFGSILFWGTTSFHRTNIWNCRSRGFLSYVASCTTHPVHSCPRKSFRISIVGQNATKWITRSTVDLERLVPYYNLEDRAALQGVVTYHVLIGVKLCYLVILLLIAIYLFKWYLVGQSGVGLFLSLRELGSSQIWCKSSVR